MKKLLSLLGCVLALSAFGQDKWTDRGRTNTIGADTLFMTVYDPDGSPVNWGIEALDLAANLASLGSIPTNATLNAVSNLLYNLTVSATNDLASTIQGDVDGKQDADDDLTDLAALAVTRGDLIVGDSTPEWSDLAVGTDGQYLTTDGTDVVWGDAPTQGTNFQSINITNQIRFRNHELAVPGSNLTNFTSFTTNMVLWFQMTNDFALMESTTTGTNPSNIVENVYYLYNNSGSDKTIYLNNTIFDVHGPQIQTVPNGRSAVVQVTIGMGTGMTAEARVFDSLGSIFTDSTFTGAIAIPLVPTADGAVNIDASSGQLFYITIEEDTVVTFTNPSEDYAPTLIVTNTGAFSLTINGPGRVYEFPASAGAVGSIPVDFLFGATNQNAQIPTQVDHVPVGNEGYYYDEISNRMVLRPSLNMDFGWQTLVSDEFMSVISGANANWTAVNLNNGIAGPNSAHIDYKHPGNTRLLVDAVGEAALYHLWLGAFKWGGENSWRIDTLVSFGATNDVGAGSSYLAQFGGANTATTNPPTQSVLFQYDPYSTKWKIVTSRTTRYTNTTDIDVITGIGQWTKLTLEGTSNTNLIASINNVPVFTNTTITQMPNDGWTPWFRNRGESGTTETSVYVDYYYMGYRPGGTRITTP